MFRRTIVLPVLAGLFCLVLGACGAGSETGATGETRQERASIEESIREYSVLTVLWQQYAAEYDALALQAFNIARDRLEDFDWETERKFPPAIVVDLDETVLDNSAYNAQLVFDDANYNPESWGGWTELQKAGLVPGASSFLEYADSKGFHICYVTNRKEQEKNSTIANMEKLRLPQLEENNLYFRTGPSSKLERRQLIEESYEIVLLIGDNLSDFSHVFDKQTAERREMLVSQNAEALGRRFIMLPNPMYGDWEGALYGYNYEMSDEEKAQLRHQLLKGY